MLLIEPFAETAAAKEIAEQQRALEARSTEFLARVERERGRKSTLLRYERDLVALKNVRTYEI